MRYKDYLTYMIILVVMINIIRCTNINLNRQTFVDQRHDIIMDLSNLAMNTLEMRLSTISDSIKFFYKEHFSVDYEEKKQHIINSLYKIIDNGTYVSEIHYGEKDGIFIAAYRDKDGAYEDTQEKIWFDFARTENQLIYMASKKEQNIKGKIKQTLFLTASAPVLSSDGKMLGVVSFNIDENLIKNALEKYLLTYGDYVVISDIKGEKCYESGEEIKNNGSIEYVRKLEETGLILRKVLSLKNLSLNIERSYAIFGVITICLSIAIVTAVFSDKRYGKNKALTLTRILFIVITIEFVLRLTPLYMDNRFSDEAYRKLCIQTEHDCITFNENSSKLQLFNLEEDIKCLIENVFDKEIVTNKLNELLMDLKVNSRNINLAFFEDKDGVLYVAPKKKENDVINDYESRIQILLTEFKSSNETDIMIYKRVRYNKKYNTFIKKIYDINGQFLGYIGIEFNAYESFSNIISCSKLYSNNDLIKFKEIDLDFNVYADVGSTTVNLGNILPEGTKEILRNNKEGNIKILYKRATYNVLFMYDEEFKRFKTMNYELYELTTQNMIKTNFRTDFIFYIIFLNILVVNYIFEKKIIKEEGEEYIPEDEITLDIKKKKAKVKRDRI